MITDLTECLVAKNILQPDMLIGIATRYSNDFKTFKLKSIHYKMNNYTFVCGGEYDDIRIEQDIPAIQIVQIEGMSLKRFAETHNFHEDGTPIKMGKRRGRKPKPRDENGLPI